MSAKVKARKFFRAKYVPPLVKCEEPRALRMARQATVTRPLPQRFDNLSKEALRPIAQRAGRNRWKNVPEEARILQQRALAATARQVYEKLPLSVRRENAARAARIQWESLTPKEREARAAASREYAAQARAAKLAKSIAVWPFPEGPQKLRRPIKDFAAKGRATQRKRARLRRFLQAKKSPH